MGLINMILGNASEIDPKEIEREFGPVLCDNETIESAYRIIRDKWVFTDKRLIMLDVQGVTGMKRNYHSIPYKSITQFSVETAGTLDDDCEMKIWVKGVDGYYKKEFGRNVNVKAIQKALAEHIL